MQRSEIESWLINALNAMPQFNPSDYFLTAFIHKAPLQPLKVGLRPLLQFININTQMRHKKGKPAFVVIQSSQDHPSDELLQLDHNAHESVYDQSSPQMDQADFKFDKEGNIIEGSQSDEDSDEDEQKQQDNSGQEEHNQTQGKRGPEALTYEQRLGKKKVKKNQQLFVVQKGPMDSSNQKNMCKGPTQVGQTQSQMIFFKDFQEKGKGRQEQYHSMKQQSQHKRQKKAIPWLSKSTMQIDDAMLRFHNEIVEFYEYLRPSVKEHAYKTSVFEIVRALVNQKYPTAEVKVFGSFATELYLPDGDIDITVIIDTEQFQEEKVYENIYKIIRKHEEKLFKQVQYIRKSKVPLIKFTHIESEFQFDISVNKIDGVTQIQQVQRMKQHYPEFAPLVFVLKCMLKIRNLSQTYTGGVGSFLLFCMVLHFLRTMHRRNVYYMLSETVLKFLDFYGINQAEWQRKSVMVADSKQIPRNKQNNILSFISPQDSSHDIGKSAFKVKDVLNVFKNRYRVIIGSNFNPKQSILKELVNPAMQQFRYFKYEKSFK